MIDLKVIDQIPIVPPIQKYNAKYPATKRDKLGHTLPEAGKQPRRFS